MTTKRIGFLDKHLPISYSKIVEAIPAMVAVYNINTGKYLYVNSAIKQLLGYEPQEFLEKGVRFVYNLVHPDDIPKIVEDNKNVLNNEKKKE